MNFVSLEYLLFFPAVLLITYLLPQKVRWVALLVASLSFYAFFSVPYLLLLVFSAFISFASAKKIAEGNKLFLLLSLSSTLLILAVFKYFIGFANLNLLPPMGISFYTFQLISYVIDVYRKKIDPEKNFFYFLLYISFFPQLVAGPIERAENLMPQFKTNLRPSEDQIYDGIYYLISGFFRKIVVADYLASYVDTIYSSAEEKTGSLLLLATILFGVQIYADFSGYSEIALGTAKLIGIDLSINFNKPYFSKNIREFYRRWHISLNTWFKDYLYIPLGGSRKGLTINIIAIFITFSLSGLWHGANLTFVIWGAFLGFLAVLETLYKRAFHKEISSHTYLIITATISWVFFRSESLSDAILIFKNIFTNFDIKSILYFDEPHKMLILLAVVISLLFIDYLPKITREIKNGNAITFNLRMTLYTIAIVIIVAFRCIEITGGQDASFIYFQF